MVEGDSDEFRASLGKHVSDNGNAP
jgi:hypothetical protein